jgi:hypothetical protein
MITVAQFDNSVNAEKWRSLFEKSWKYLKDNNKLKTRDANENGKIAFSNLAHYFSYLEDLISENPMYLMLPIDEEPFEINANTREIKIPSAFSKCSGVQSDNNAEIITFTIDRYFDYQDLSLAQIAIQWINETTNAEAVSIINLIDLETYGKENKIRFGWPLTSEMTAAAGKLKFAVRFFMKNEKSGEYDYLFNTLPASIPIKETLSHKDGLRENTVGIDYFKTFVKNSNNPSYTIPQPVVFQKDLPEIASIGEDDTLTLSVRAASADLNPINYQWYYDEDKYDVYEWTSERP